eukprot:1019410-Rhodomonas_salina.1
MEDLRDRSSVDFSSNTSWVVDMILSLHQDDTKIAEYMEEHCEAFKFDPRVGIATQKQHNIHQGYIDKVLAFMEEAYSIVAKSVVAVMTWDSVVLGGTDGCRRGFPSVLFLDVVE